MVRPYSGEEEDRNSYKGRGKALIVVIAAAVFAIGYIAAGYIIQAFEKL